MLNVQNPALYHPRTGPQPIMFQPAPVAAQRGTLTPGQPLQIGAYSVVVERYLSEGGFAHVYLVQSTVSIMGTTQHVLKRIACADNEMLKEVGQEVQVMKLLRGHPNIVHLHASSSEPLPDGSSVVYILMEFCSGGGIIDMMNRRLRERLTEAEILQVFVDVCEAVARMHALKPPLLHRDLKVENILQASPNSFKLCDFGSAAPASPTPPSNPVQLRLLEADLNKHTTLQYRAPEMVDVAQRRPIDTKSDVWALGVLLYKLCFYTTPFESHGPIAILTVSYTIPPYPVYSREMIALIASMLRDHGTQRPSVFEVLAEVHRMRGTKSAFSYDTPTPALLPRSQPSTSKGPPRQGISSTALAAQQEVLQAVAPLRHQRSVRTHISGPAPPSRSVDLWDDAAIGKKSDFGAKLANKPSSATASVSGSDQPSVGSAFRNDTRNSRPTSGLQMETPPLAPRPFMPTGTKQDSLSSRPPSSLNDARRPSPLPTSSQATGQKTRPPDFISMPSASGIGGTSFPPLTSRSSKPPAFVSPADSAASFEDRFPPIEELTTSFEKVFSPSIELSEPVLSNRGSSIRPSNVTSAQPSQVSGGVVLSPPSTAQDRPISFLGPSRSSTRVPMVASPPSASPNPVSARSENVTGVAMRDPATFSPIGSRSPGDVRGNMPLGRPPSANPTVAGQLPNSSKAQTSQPGRTGPLKRLDADFSRPKKGPRKKSTGSPTTAKYQTQDLLLVEKPKVRDWLTGDDNMSDPVVPQPSKPSRSPISSGAEGAGASANGRRPSPVASVKPVLQSFFSKPPVASKPSMQSPTSPRAPSPSRSLSTWDQNNSNVSTAGASAFKRYTMATAPPTQAAPISSSSSNVTRSGTLSSTLDRRSSMAGMPKPVQKPAHLRQTSTTSPRHDSIAKSDKPSVREQSVALSDNWSPVESRFPTGSPSSDEGPEEARGARRPMGSRQASERPERILDQPPPVAPKPSMEASLNFPDRKRLSPLSGRPDDVRPSPPKPSPSPNLMDEENEEIRGPLPAPRMSSFISRQPMPSLAADRPSSGTPARPRPQSMFLSNSMMQTMSSLQVPQDKAPVVAAERRNPRRGSISEMVSKYEALSSPTAEVPPMPSSPTKATSGKAVANEPARPDASPVRSPSPSKPVFSPTIAPVSRVDTSPIRREEPNLVLPSSSSASNLSRRKTLGAPLPLNRDYGPTEMAVGLPGLARARPSPGKLTSMAVNAGSEQRDLTPRALPGLARSPSPTKPSMAKSMFEAATSSVTNADVEKSLYPSASISPVQYFRPTPSSLNMPQAPTSQSSQLSQTRPSRPVSVQPAKETSDPPSSPEQPFQGVSKLIDQWQKKTESGVTRPERKPVTWERKK